MEYIYRNPRPRLLVTANGGHTPFPCYSVSRYIVTTTYPLSDDELKALFASGAVGYGQESRVVEQTESSDTVPCVGIKGDEVIENPLNPYSGKPYKPIQMPVYTYHVETVCGSGD
jgi:hypothetical protein